MSQYNNKNEKNIAIVGGGFTGTSAAIHQIDEYTKLAASNPDLPTLVVSIFDKNGWFESGLPYHAEEDVFLLNQPASAMSLFPNDTDHFTRWLGDSGDTFATRGQYGAYLKDSLKKSFDRAAEKKVPIILNKQAISIDKIEFGSDQVFLLNNADEIKRSADVVFVATGHQRSDFLNEYDSLDNFFAGSYSVKDVESSVKELPRDAGVGIVGTGQSMMDALAVLDRIHFTGPIYAFSREGVLPWPYKTAETVSKLDAYVPVYLCAEGVLKDKSVSFQDLKKLFDLEIENATRTEYNVADVLYATKLDKIKKIAASDDDFHRFEAYWKKVYGNPTSPERYAIFKRYLDTGQLTLIKESISSEQLSRDERTGNFEVLSAISDQPISLKAVFNAAAFDRDSFRSPILQQLKEQGVLLIDGNVIRPGQQFDDRLFVVGPPTSPSKWGVETFRPAIEGAAKKSIQHILKT